MTARRRFSASVLGGTLLGALVVWTPGAPAAHAADRAQLTVTIDGRAVSSATEQRPIRLDPRRPATLRVRVTNAGGAPLEVATVRLHGQVMALSFFTYDTSVGVTVAPGATEERTFVVDLVGLGGQATGLIQGSASVLDPDRRTLASEPVVVDVRGSLRSVYGLFGLAVAVLTALSLAGALIALGSHRLPDNRWRRGLRFLTPGLGCGLVVVFTLSALRVFVPRPGRWIPILLVSGALLFVAGYLTPSPDDDDEDEEEDEGDDEVDGLDEGVEDQSGLAQAPRSPRSVGGSA